MDNINLRPFNPSKDVAQDLGLGGLSTEYTVTNPAPGGGYWNIPSIWWDDRGNPVVVNPDDAQLFAMEYERKTGTRFDRYEDSGPAEFRAMNRSAMGGGLSDLAGRR